MKTKTTDDPEALTLDCTCGRRAGVLLRRWEKYRCGCGRLWWALRPRKDGPLQVFPCNAAADAAEDKRIQKQLREEFEP